MQKIICGIDEAGRGPVIGPMVIAACTIKEEDEPKLAMIGVKDSKLLSPKERARLYDEVIRAVQKYKIRIIAPKEIDNALSDKKSNLNFLEANTSAELITSLKPTTATLDCPSINTSAYKEYVQERIKSKTEIIAEHKADLNHPIVSAASILAKVTRDREIQKLTDEIGVNFGSGYPSDPLTVEFLEKNYEKHEQIFRKTWQSYKNIINKKAQTNLEKWF
jgi:ribonuclease HII